jgi:small conductance mechanosensitive channel
MLFQTVPIDVRDIVDTDDVTGIDVMTAVLIIAAGVVIALVVKRLMRKWLSTVDGLPLEAREAVSRMTGYLIMLIGVLIALPYLGFESQPVLLILLVIAVLVFFASRPLLESFTAGLILQARGPFRVGDIIRHEGLIGVAQETNGRTTIILTPEGERVAIPNISMIRQPITNLSAEGARRTTVNVGVAYGTDLDFAVTTIENAISGLERVLTEPAPTVGALAYDESAIRIQVWCWHLPSVMDEFLARDEIVRSINRALRSADIVIAFPQRDVWLREPPDGASEEGEG